MNHPRSPDRIDRRVGRTSIERLRSLVGSISTSLSARISMPLRLRVSYATLLLALAVALALSTRSPGDPPAGLGAPGNSGAPSNAAAPGNPAAQSDLAAPVNETAPGNDTVSGGGTAKTAPASGQELSRAQAIELVQVRYRARVVRSSETQDKSGRRVYVLRLLSGSGKVWTVHIDAHTGAEVP
jgi:hypothetical protein